MSKLSTLKNDVLLNLTVVSDTHIDIKHPFPFLPKMYLKCALSEAEKSKVPVDAFIIIGDTTSRGSEENWKLTRDVFKKVSHPAKNIIPVIGNHDTWSDDGKAFERYFSNCTQITGEKYERTYFKKEINGYSLIFIGAEKEGGCGALISGEQVQWLKAEMEISSKNNKPVFVFCHQSFNQKHGLPVTFDKEVKKDVPLTEGGIGDKSEEIENILRQYKNVYYFSGHSHMGFSGVGSYKKRGYSSFEKSGDVTLVNLPSLACGNHHGEDNSMCLGATIEVYENEVIIRPRNFFKHRYLTKVDIKDGKPYYCQKITN